MLSVLNIRKNYEGKPLLRGISFNVEKGETICLLGHSGSGKSTLLRIIAGIEEADSGLISWDGLDMKNIPIHERNFGFMFQDYGLFPHKNVFENVAFGLRMQNYPKTEITNRVLQELDKVKMLSFANRSVTELSGGEQQRVALARALAPQPKLLMLDEPLGALDKTLRGQLLKEIRKLLHETEIPAIYVTHDQEEAFTIGDRLVLIDSGEIKQIGTPKAIYQHPNNAWVAGYLGLNNIIRGEVVTSYPFVIKTSVGVFSLLKQETENFYRGQIVQLLIRPDAIDLNQDSINTISGTIIDSVFLGQGYRIVLDCETASFDFDVQTEYMIGEQKTLAIVPQGLTCFPDDKAVQL